MLSGLPAGLPAHISSDIDVGIGRGWQGVGSEGWGRRAGLPCAGHGRFQAAPQPAQGMRCVPEGSQRARQGPWPVEEAPRAGPFASLPGPGTARGLESKGCSPRVHAFQYQKQ